MQNSTLASASALKFFLVGFPYELKRSNYETKWPRYDLVHVSHDEKIPHGTNFALNKLFRGEMRVGDETEDYKTMFIDDVICVKTIPCKIRQEKIQTLDRINDKVKVFTAFNVVATVCGLVGYYYAPQQFTTTFGVAAGVTTMMSLFGSIKSSTLTKEMNNWQPYDHSAQRRSLATRTSANLLKKSPYLLNYITPTEANYLWMQNIKQQKQQYNQCQAASPTSKAKFVISFFNETSFILLLDVFGTEEQKGTFDKNRLKLLELVHNYNDITKKYNQELQRLEKERRITIREETASVATTREFLDIHKYHNNAQAPLSLGTTLMYDVCDGILETQQQSIKQQINAISGKDKVELDVSYQLALNEIFVKLQDTFPDTTTSATAQDKVQIPSLL
jgi:hypothetical protein